MKRITVSLPDELVDQVKEAAGGEGQVSAYVATALADYAERESLDAILADWGAQSPIPSDVSRQVGAELAAAGFPARRTRRGRAS